MKTKTLSTLAAVIIITPGTIREPMRPVQLEVRMAQPCTGSGEFRIQSGGRQVFSFIQHKPYGSFFFQLRTTGPVNGSKQCQVFAGQHAGELNLVYQFDAPGGATNFVLYADPKTP